MSFNGLLQNDATNCLLFLLLLLPPRLQLPLVP